jgi:hypothetical protein
MPLRIFGFAIRISSDHSTKIRQKDFKQIHHKEGTNTVAPIITWDLKCRLCCKLKFKLVTIKDVRS